MLDGAYGQRKILERRAFLSQPWLKGLSGKEHVILYNRASHIKVLMDVGGTQRRPASLLRQTAGLVGVAITTVRPPALRDSGIWLKVGVASINSYTAGVAPGGWTDRLRQRAQGRSYYFLLIPRSIQGYGAIPCDSIADMMVPRAVALSTQVESLLELAVDRDATKAPPLPPPGALPAQEGSPLPPPPPPPPTASPSSTELMKRYRSSARERVVGSRANLCIDIFLPVGHSTPCSTPEPAARPHSFS